MLAGVHAQVGCYLQMHAWVISKGSEASWTCVQGLFRGSDSCTGEQVKDALEDRN